MRGKQQDGTAVPRGGQAVPGRREVVGRGPQAATRGRLLLGVTGALQAGGEHHMGRVEVRMQPLSSLAQQPRVPVASVKEVVQQLTPDPLFGLGRGAPGEQQQRGDHGGALQGALVDRVEAGVAAQHEGAEQLASGGDGRDPVVAVSHRVPVRAGRFEGVAGRLIRVGELHGAVEDLGDGRGHVVHSAAAQHQLGEPVVHVGGALDDAAAVTDDLVGALQLVQRLTGLGEQVRGVDGRGGERREGAEERDLLALEDPRAPVGGEQHPDHLRSQHERHAEDGDEPLVPHPRVDAAGVLEAHVVPVVVGDVGPRGLCDEAAEALPHAEPELLEAGRDRALGDPHVGVAPDRVVQRQIGDVGAEQRAGPLDDGLQHRVQIAQAREVVRGLEQGGQLRLAAPPALHLRAYAQRERLGRLECRYPLGRSALSPGEQHGLFIGIGGGAPGEQFQERGLRVLGGHRAGGGG